MNYHGPLYKKYAVKFTSQQDILIRALGMPPTNVLTQPPLDLPAFTVIRELKYPVDGATSPLIRALNEDLRCTPWWVV